ncbi:MAG: hypothetical protein HHAS10_00590 [Candidatus Altimarinota bacterium]
MIPKVKKRKYYGHSLYNIYYILHLSRTCTRRARMESTTTGASMSPFESLFDQGQGPQELESLFEMLQGIEGLESLIRNQGRPKKLDLVDATISIAMMMMVDVPKEVIRDSQLKSGISQLKSELESAVQAHLAPLETLAKAAADRHNRALIARLAKRKLSPEGLLEQCTPRLALAVEAFRRELAEARAEQAMCYADYCHGELRTIEAEARKRHHRSTARRAGAAARRVKQKVPPKGGCINNGAHEAPHTRPPSGGLFFIKKPSFRGIYFGFLLRFFFRSHRYIRSFEFLS